MFTGLSAFPLTPLAHDAVDEAAFVRLVASWAAPVQQTAETNN